VPHVCGRGTARALERTFYLPVTAMRNPALVPLHVVEELVRRRLAD
jgi:hypothetical protein